MRRSFHFCFGANVSRSGPGTASAVGMQHWQAERAKKNPPRNGPTIRAAGRESTRGTRHGHRTMDRIPIIMVHLHASHCRVLHQTIGKPTPVSCIKAHRLRVCSNFPPRSPSRGPSKVRQSIPTRYLDLPQFPLIPLYGLL